MALPPPPPFKRYKNSLRVHCTRAKKVNVDKGGKRVRRTIWRGGALYMYSCIVKGKRNFVRPRDFWTGFRKFRRDDVAAAPVYTV
jgi:hypothetical protein